MTLNNPNLHKLLSRSKHVINQVKKAKLNLTQQTGEKVEKIGMKSDKVEKSDKIRKNPIFKLSSSKGFEGGTIKQLRINTLPDIIDEPCLFGPDYETPKFSTAFTVKIQSEEKQDLMSTFGFNKKGKLRSQKTERSTKLKGKQNIQNRDDSVNRIKGKQLKKKFQSTLNFGTARQRVKTQFGVRKFF